MFSRAIITNREGYTNEYLTRAILQVFHTVTRQNNEYIQYQFVFDVVTVSEKLESSLEW